MKGLRGIVIALAIFLISVAANAQGKRAIETNDAPKAIGPYSQAIVANGFVYTAGQVGTDPKTGSLVAGGIAEQTEQALNNLEAVLKAAGASLDAAIKTTVFLTEMNDFAAMNEIYGKRFSKPYPARSSVQVARLPRDARVEIEIVALIKR
jgi:2-iminobutanoate/2-iminopropanoate deaminase